MEQLSDLEVSYLPQRLQAEIRVRDNNLYFFVNELQVFS